MQDRNLLWVGHLSSEGLLTHSHSFTLGQFKHISHFTCTSLGYRGKPEYPEKIHIDVERMYKFYPVTPIRNPCLFVFFPLKFYKTTLNKMILFEPTVYLNSYGMNTSRRGRVWMYLLYSCSQAVLIHAPLRLTSQCRVCCKIIKEPFRQCICKIISDLDWGTTFSCVVL